MIGDYLKIETDKQYYLPGDTINGTVVIHLEKSTKVQRLDLRFHGREKVSIPEGRYSATATNEMANLALQFLGNQTVSGDVRVPFQFTLPGNALPTYEGSYTSVSWELYAKLHISWLNDLENTVSLRVWTASSANPAGVAAENPEPGPKASLKLPSNIFQPGESIKGELVVEDPRRLRSVRVAVVLTEQAAAAGTFTTADRIYHQTVAQLVWKKEQLTVGSPIDFDLNIPQNSTTSYKGQLSSVSWNVKLTLDIPYADDVNVYAPILVAVRKALAAAMSAVPSPGRIPVVVEAGGASQTIETVKESTAVFSTGEVRSGTVTTPSVTSEKTDTESLILKILADGGSKDLIEIRNQLQTTTTEFIDLNSVMKTCDQLLDKGRLKRTGTGEFFVHYSLA